MQKITVTEEKKMTVPQRKEAMPYRLMADGFIIATVSKDGDVPKVLELDEPIGKTKCPNCKFEYDLPGKDTGPSFFSIQHP